MSASDLPSGPADRSPEPTLREILGGRGGALDATVPVLAFVLGWLGAQQLGAGVPVAWGALVSVVAGIVVAGVRLATGGRPRAVLLGLLGVAAAALVALYTGRAVDYFLIQIVTNAASALGWAVSIVVRWPLLGIVVGTVLRQRTRWRRDPDLLRAYRLASWVWVGQYLVRLAVFIPLYLADLVVPLTAARVTLTWPLVAACIAVSWRVVQRSLPAGHPGMFYPVDPAATPDERPRGAGLPDEPDGVRR